MLEVGMSFSDPAYVQAYVAMREFPKIHAPVAEAITLFASEARGAIDFGSCTGLLSAQAVALGRSFCLGIEGNRSVIERAVAHPRVRYFNFYIATDTLSRLDTILTEFKPTLLIARRVFPEIDLYDGETFNALPELLHRCGIKKIILQGRNPVANPRTRLYSAEKEAEALSSCYERRYSKRSVIFMVSK